MTGSALALPTTSNEQSWDDETRALMASAGLVHRDYDGKETTAPRSVVASFLHQCQRTRLDPLARQIYLIARKNNGQLVWTTQVSIDGLRLIAERSGHYAGQGDVEWLTEDGRWVDVWLPAYGKHPTAARATVYRDDFHAPLRAVALWDSYVQTKRNGDVTSMWEQHGPGQIAKCAEALALRKAFPNDLSGIYTTDEMQQADGGVLTAAASRETAQPGDGEEWRGPITDASTIDELGAVWADAQAAHALNLVLDGRALGDIMREKKQHLLAAEAQRKHQDAAAEDVVDAEPYEDETPF